MTDNTTTLPPCARRLICIFLPSSPLRLNDRDSLFPPSHHSLILASSFNLQLMKFRLCSQFHFVPAEVNFFKNSLWVRVRWCRLSRRWNSFIFRRILPRCPVIKLDEGWRDGQVIIFSSPWTWWPVSRLMRLCDLHGFGLFTRSVFEGNSLIIQPLQAVRGFNMS